MPDDFQSLNFSPGSVRYLEAHHDWNPRALDHILCLSLWTATSSYGAEPTSTANAVNDFSVIAGAGIPFPTARNSFRAQLAGSKICSYSTSERSRAGPERGPRRQRRGYRAFDRGDIAGYADEGFATEGHCEADFDEFHVGNFTAASAPSMSEATERLEHSERFERGSFQVSTAAFPGSGARPRCRGDQAREGKHAAARSACRLPSRESRLVSSLRLRFDW